MKILPIRFLFISFCLLISGFAHSQNQKLIDSLMQVLELEVSSKKKVDTFVELASAYQNTDSVNTALYANKALDLAYETGYIEGTIKPLYSIGVITMRKGYYDEAETLFLQMANLSEKNNFHEGKASAFYGLGWMNGVRGKPDEALDYLLQSMAIYKELDAKKELASGYNIMGILYDKQGSQNKALEYYFLSLKLNEALGIKPGMASNYSNIGIIYKNQDDYEKAIEYYEKSLNLYRELGIKRGMASNYNNIGNILFDQGDYEKALEYHLESLRIKEDEGDKRGIAYNYNTIGQDLVKLGRNDEALEYHLNSLRIFDEIGVQADKSFSLFYIGNAYKEKNQLRIAREYLQKGLELAQEFGYTRVIQDAAAKLSEVEKELGNYKTAYEAQVLYKQMADSLDNEESIKDIARLAAEYKFKKEKDSLQLAKEQEILLFSERAKRTEFRNRVILICIVLTLITGIVTFILVNKISQRKKLESLRNRISRDLHDEIGSNLSSISLFGVVAGKSIEEDPEKARQLLSKINSNAIQSIESMNDIVWAIKSENDSLKHLINRMRSYATELETTGEWDINIQYDSKIANKNLSLIQRRNTYLIFKEAINNAVKYSQGSKIDIKIKAEKNTLKMEIKDDGKGFNPKEVSDNGQLFGGNGLKNMKIRANELGGEMKILSKRGKGTKIMTLFSN